MATTTALGEILNVPLSSITGGVILGAGIGSSGGPISDSGIGAEVNIGIGTGVGFGLCPISTIVVASGIGPTIKYTLTNTSMVIPAIFSLLKVSFLISLTEPYLLS